jgi:hypothetical protein
MKSQIKLIIDHIGRFIIGTVVSETDTVLRLGKPIILHVQPNQSGQLQVQTLPLLFNEFLSDKDTNIWTYTKESIVISDAVLEEKLTQQYESMVNPTPIAQSAPEVVKLFED